VSERQWERDATVRALPEVHLLATSNYLDLGKFLRESEQRRQKYFQLIDETSAMIHNFCDGCHVPDRALRDAIAVVLVLDRTFIPFITNQGGGGELRDASKKQTIVDAAAGTILGQYFNARGDLSSR